MMPYRNHALALEPEPAEQAIASALAPIVFEDGLYGFAGCSSFQLLATSRPGLYRLQSTEHEALCFLVADPFRFFAGYVVDLPAFDVARLDARDPTDVALVVTVTLPERGGRIGTANLQGPIAINVRTRRGRQIILNQPSWDVREPLDLLALS